MSIEFGRLVDVYGLRTDLESGSVRRVLFRSDVVISTDIVDERPSGSELADTAIRFDFLQSDPATLTPRLFIPREIGGASFEALYLDLSRSLPKLTASKFGQDISRRPFPVVPRNAAFRLLFSEPLGVSPDFFALRDVAGNAIGQRNTDAVQLLRIVRTPLDDDVTGDFARVPIRVIPRGREMVIDSVFLGEEGLRYGVRNNPAGLPSSLDQTSANVRIAIALEGELAIQDVFAPEDSGFLGTNANGVRSVIRDFRSGNSMDESALISRGFLRDPERPKLLGELPFLLAAVAPDPDDEPGQVQITVYKNGRTHEIDAGDGLRIVTTDAEGDPLTLTSEVVLDPVEDAGQPGAQFVTMAVSSVEGLLERDPRRRADYPAEMDSAEGRDWLRTNADRVVLVTTFQASRPSADGESTDAGDRLENFCVFTPSPIPQAEGIDPEPGAPSLPNLHVSPFAGAVLQFTKPIDIETVSPFDTFFFATRDLLDDAAFAEFVDRRGIANHEALSRAKFATPHLVDSRVFDENGSATRVRVQPVKGFYLDDEMRRDVPTDLDLATDGSLENRASTTHAYFLHVLAGLSGIRDLAGNNLDLQSQNSAIESVTMPFYLDGRRFQNGGEEPPFFENNRVVSVVRRFADRDEDEQPSVYRFGLPEESTQKIPDMFGDFSIAAGQLVGRRPSRVTRYVDNLNQISAPSQDSIFRWCPSAHVAPFFGVEGTLSPITAGTPFGRGIQNPLNPFGARLQTVWRETDLSLSRLDPADFNLDVEQLYWAPVESEPIFFDVFDSVSLFLGHSEFRPEPCVGSQSALSVFPQSGLQGQNLDENYAHNQALTGIGSDPDRGAFPAPHLAYADREFVIDQAEVQREPNKINRYLSLPRFEEPYFVWRDETVMVQGGMTRRGADNETVALPDPYMVSPWYAGQCAPVSVDPLTGQMVRTQGMWDNRLNLHLPNSATEDLFTGGMLGSVALPLLADFQTFCDSPQLPAGGLGFLANGTNGWQISLAVTSSADPDFRVFSAGSVPTGCIGPGDTEWNRASGQPGTQPADGGDNSLYWMRADFLKRQTVATAGFLEIDDPHRMPRREDNQDFDPRLGPFYPGGRPASVLPAFEWHTVPPLAMLPPGTLVTPEFRVASQTVEAPWSDPLSTNDAGGPNGVPNPCFALNPRIAGDAHIRKFDRRPFRGSGAPREFWSHAYTEHLSDYTRDIDEVLDPAFLRQFQGPTMGDRLDPELVRYLSWRLVMRSDADLDAAIPAAIRGFGISYRFE